MSDIPFPGPAVLPRLKVVQGEVYQIYTNIDYVELRNHPTNPSVKLYQLKNGIDAPFLLMNLRFVREKSGSIRFSSFLPTDPVFKPWQLVATFIVADQDFTDGINGILGDHWSLS